MIRKIVSVKNLGNFRNLNPGRGSWNGILDKTNIIYAQNGNGKTTLSILFQSLSGDDGLLQKKRTFDAESNVQIKLISEENKEIKYAENKWNQKFPDIKVFNSHFIENNFFVVNRQWVDSLSSNLEFVYGEDKLKTIERRNEVVRKINKIKVEIKDLKEENKDREIQDLRLELSELKEEQKRLTKMTTTVSSESMNIYIEKVNSILQLFNPRLKVTNLKQKKNIFHYGLRVSNHDVTTLDKKIFPLKYALSEGDKNALTFSFFLADLEFIKDLDNSFVVIDDPVSSFDYSRKNSTINLLYTLNKRVGKLIILTHDLNFSHDLYRKFNGNCQMLKIVFNGVSSNIIEHDISTEAMTGIFKDLKTLNNFLKEGANSDSELREVVRCVRPVIEGMLRIKFYGLIKEDEWLGDMIRKITESNEDDPFFSCKNSLSELQEINDYSKSYHHSNPYYNELSMNAHELRVYVERTMKLLREI